MGTGRRRRYARTLRTRFHVPLGAQGRGRRGVSVRCYAYCHDRSPVTREFRPAATPDRQQQAACGSRRVVSFRRADGPTPLRGPELT